MRIRIRRLGALMVACVVGVALSLVIAVPLLGARGTAPTSLRAGSIIGGGGGAICAFCVGNGVTFGSLNPTAINNLFTTTGITSANLETLIGNLSPTQIQGITAANLNLLDPTALTSAAPSLSIGQVGSLSNTQLSGVLGSLTKDNFVGILNSQFTGLSAGAINSALPSNLALLTPAQVDGVSVDVVDGLDAAHATSLLSSLNDCAEFGCSFVAGGATGRLTPAAGICLACSTTAKVPSGVATGVTGAFTGSVTHAVFAPGTLGTAGTATIASTLKIGQSSLSPSLEVDKTALPGGTVISFIPGNLTKLGAVAPRSVKLIAALGVGWQAPGGSTPDAKKPLQITVADPNAKPGDTLYEVVAGALVAVPNAVSAGSWHAIFSGDPGFVLAQAAETNPGPSPSPIPTPPPTAGGGTIQSSPVTAPPNTGGGPVETPSFDVAIGCAALALLGGRIAAHCRRRATG